MGWSARGVADQPVALTGHRKAVLAWMNFAAWTSRPPRPSCW
jgi:hypothetical protein